MTGVRVVRGDPDDDELAAVVAVLTALGGREEDTPAPADPPFGRRPPRASFVAAAAWVSPCSSSPPRCR